VSQPLVISDNKDLIISFSEALTGDKDGFCVPYLSTSVHTNFFTGGLTLACERPDSLSKRIVVGSSRYEKIK